MSLDLRSPRSRYNIRWKRRRRITGKKEEETREQEKEKEEKARNYAGIRDEYKTENS
jgi:hypothetical protein